MPDVGSSGKTVFCCPYAAMLLLYTWPPAVVGGHMAERFGFCLVVCKLRMTELLTSSPNQFGRSAELRFGVKMILFLTYLIMRLLCQQALLFGIVIGVLDCWSDRRTVPGLILVRLEVKPWLPFLGQGLFASIGKGKPT